MLKLEQARTIVEAAQSKAHQMKLDPLAIVVLDARGAVRFAIAEDGASLKRFEIAHGKAHGAVATGHGSRELDRRAQARPHFIAAITHAVGPLVPVPGGVLIKDKSGTILGAVGVSGDRSERDETVAEAGIEAAGLIADTGSEW